MSVSDKYVSSSNITVFPSTKRGNVQVSARLLSEASLVSIVNRLVDTDSFVITKDADYAANKKFEFNIHGYYFCVDPISTVLNQFGSATAIYGNIKLQQSGDYNELYGQDTNNVYYGVQFSDTALGGEYLSLKIFEKSGNTWIIPTSSRIKYYSSSVDIDVSIIDDGTIA